MRPRPAQEIRLVDVCEHLSALDAVLTGLYGMIADNDEYAPETYQAKMARCAFVLVREADAELTHIKNLILDPAYSQEDTCASALATE